MQVFAVAPKENRMVLDTKVPESTPKMYVHNIGHVSVYAEVHHDTASGWDKIVTGKLINPAESTEMKTSQKGYFRTGLYLQNKSENRALLYCDYQDHKIGDCVPDGGRKVEMDIDAIAKEYSSFLVKKIPTVGRALSTIVQFFWPGTEEPSVWDHVFNKVGNLIDPKSNEVIRGILGGDLKRLHERLLLLEEDLEDHSHDAAVHFMNIAQELISFEKKFVFTEEDNYNFDEVNYYILPMYSNMVTLKLTFYAFSILNQNKIGLTDYQVRRLKGNSERLVYDPSGAIHHVTNVSLERVQNELNYCIPSEVFDAVATVRTYCALFGIEYIAYWKYLLMHPGADEKPYNDALCYSKGFGTRTPDQAAEIIQVDLGSFLTPKLIDRNRIKIENIGVAWNRYENKIIGIVYNYEDRSDYIQGSIKDGETHEVTYDGSHLTRLSAWGENELNCLEFAFSDGRVKTVGTKTRVHKDFQLENHHIAGIFIGFPAAGYVAKNISVSYQMTTEKWYLEF